jgi:translation initiation factor 2 subunit 1
MATEPEMPPRFRFYKKDFPNMSDLVMGKVTKRGQWEAYFDLPEYRGVSGLLLYSELPRQRDLRAAGKNLKDLDCLSISGVDVRKKHVDLSKRKVPPNEILEFKKRYAKAKTVNDIVCRVAQICGLREDRQLEDLFENSVWHFATKDNIESAYKAFKRAARDPTVLDECKIDDRIKSCLLRNICHHFPLTRLRIQAVVALTCTYYEGVDAIKRALKCGLAMSTDIIPIRIFLLASSEYMISAETWDRKEGFKIINEALDAIRAEIIKARGTFKLQQEPKTIILDSDEASVSSDETIIPDSDKDSVSTDSDKDSVSTDSVVGIKKLGTSK